MQKKLKKIPKVEIYDLMPKVEEEVKQTNTKKINKWSLRYFILLSLIILYGVVYKRQGVDYWYFSTIIYFIIAILFVWWLKDD